MTAPWLPAALRAGADGIYALEATTGLIIAHATWLDREDFARFIHVRASITDPAVELASIDWEAAISALNAGELPSSGGEQRMLRLAASLAGQAPVSLVDAITGIDDRNTGLLIRAVLHASGQRQFPSSVPAVVGGNRVGQEHGAIKPPSAVPRVRCPCVLTALAGHP